MNRACGRHFPLHPKHNVGGSQENATHTRTETDVAARGINRKMVRACAPARADIIKAGPRLLFTNIEITVYSLFLIHGLMSIFLYRK